MLVTHTLRFQEPSGQRVFFPSERPFGFLTQQTDCGRRLAGIPNSAGVTSRCTRDFPDTHTHSRRNQGSISLPPSSWKETAAFLEKTLEFPRKSSLRSLRLFSTHQHPQGNTALGTSAGKPGRRRLRTSQEGDPHPHPPCTASTLPQRLPIRASANGSCGRLS